jgi:ferredoxin-thioredoxin reductase catalytic chain
MSDEISVSENEVEEYYRQLKKDAGNAGYFLNPDIDFTRDLVKGILVNKKRYGYENCPCRLASGNKAEDLDIICPCDYRDPDVSEFGSCY